MENEVKEKVELHELDGGFEITHPCKKASGAALVLEILKGGPTPPPAATFQAGNVGTRESWLSPNNCGIQSPCKGQRAKHAQTQSNPSNGELASEHLPNQGHLNVYVVRTRVSLEVRGFMADISRLWLCKCGGFLLVGHQININGLMIVMANARDECRKSSGNRIYSEQR